MCALDWPSGVRHESGMVLKVAHSGQQNEIWKEKGKNGKRVWEQVEPRETEVQMGRWSE